VVWIVAQVKKMMYKSQQRKNAQGRLDFGATVS
jgi:hypothetical protein